MSHSVTAKPPCDCWQHPFRVCGICQGWESLARSDSGGIEVILNREHIIGVYRFEPGRYRITRLDPIDDNTFPF